MRFRRGMGGTSMWPLCFKYGVAAITYGPVAEVDLKKFSKEKPPPGWDELAPAQKFSLKSVAFDMMEGDTIYVRDKGNIVAKGEVTGTYFFDNKDELPWAHRVPVNWDTDFPAVSIDNIGSIQSTVCRLQQTDIIKVENLIRRTLKIVKLNEAMEGEIFQKEAEFRARNRALIESKKAISDYKCEVCDFDFFVTYGEIGKEYIIAHHLAPIGKRKKSTKTTLDDIALVCANCHAMIHKTDPPININDLRKMFNHYEDPAP